MRCLELSMKMLRKEGWVCAKAEHWNAFARIRQDLFGFIDVVCLQDRQIVGIQVVNTHLQDHIDKIRGNGAAVSWINCGGRIVIHNWKRRSKNKVKRWHCEIIEVTA